MAVESVAVALEKRPIVLALIVPYDHAVKGSILVPADLASNVAELHRFLFGTENYVPTQNVQRISGNISADTGIGAQPIQIETLIVN